MTFTIAFMTPLSLMAARDNWRGQPRAGFVKQLKKIGTPAPAPTAVAESQKTVQG